MHAAPFAFESMYQGNDDPWHLRSRWYEERKRALTLACLPRRRYANACEPGCANAELSAALATRCDRLLATDGSAQAVDLARRRLAECPNVRVEQASMPEDWPVTERFDLVVVSELAYYLSAEAIDALAARARASLGEDGTLLACHWRHPIDGCALNGDAVHARLERALGWTSICCVVEADLRIDVWCADPRSVAQREGFA